MSGDLLAPYVLVVAKSLGDDDDDDGDDDDDDNDDDDDSDVETDLSKNSYRRSFS